MTTKELKKTGDESLDKWIMYFDLEEGIKTNTKFIKLLTNKDLDKYFLTISPPQNIEDNDFPDDGLLENDFRKAAFEEEEDTTEEKTRLVLAIYYGANLKPWQIKYKEVFYEVIEKAFIEADYEKYGIIFEKAIKIAVEKKYIEQSEFTGVAFLRGMVIGKRYKTKQSENKLKWQQRFNQLKVKLGI